MTPSIDLLTKLYRDKRLTKGAAVAYIYLLHNIKATERKGYLARDLIIRMEEVLRIGINGSGIQALQMLARGGYINLYHKPDNQKSYYVDFVEV